MRNQFDRSITSFDSLANCIDFVAKHYPETQTTQLSTGKNISTGAETAIEVPKFLYRGEAYNYPTTTSSMNRMLHTETIILSVRKLIETLSQRVDNELQTFLQLEPMLSAGFLQHYGMPTELLDVTSSLGVAAFFASFGKVGSKGVLCVFPVDNVASKSIIIDLTQHPYAERPRRQAAYAFYHHTFRDIKDSKCIDELKLDWFDFTLQETDIIQYQIRKDLLDAHNDKVAGVLQLILDDFEKLDDSAAHWLADRVAPAPFVARVIDYWEQLPNQPKTVELVSLADAGLPYDEQCERENNYKKWSAAFPESRPHKLKPDTGMEPMR